MPACLQRFEKSEDIICQSNLLEGQSHKPQVPSSKNQIPSSKHSTSISFWILVFWDLSLGILKCMDLSCCQEKQLIKGSPVFLLL